MGFQVKALEYLKLRSVLAHIDFAEGLIHPFKHVEAIEKNIVQFGSYMSFVVNLTS